MRTAGSRCERVLIVEDDRDILDALSELLLMEGVKAVQRAQSVAEAEQVLASGFAPSAIVLDLLLDNDRGESLISRLQADPNLSRIPVIAVSGDNRSLVRVRGSVARTLLKPTSLDDVVQTLADICNA